MLTKNNFHKFVKNTISNVNFLPGINTKFNNITI